MIPSAGGAPTPVTELAQGEATHRWPQILPGGKAVLFTSHTAITGFDGANIEVMTLADHHRKTLQRGGTFGTLPARVERERVLGLHQQRNSVCPALRPRQVGSAWRAIAGAGGGCLYPNMEVPHSSIFHETERWYTAAAERRKLIWSPCSGWMPPARRSRCCRNPVAMNGRVCRRTASGWRWTTGRISGCMKPQRDTMTRLTFGAGRSIAPVWSRDGRYIAFNGPGGIFWVRPTALAKPQLLASGQNSSRSVFLRARWKAAGIQRSESGYSVRPRDGDRR